MLNVKKLKAKTIFGQMIYMGKEGKLLKKAVVLESVPTKKVIKPRIIEKDSILKGFKNEAEKNLFRKLIEKEVEGYLPPEIINLI